MKPIRDYNDGQWLLLLWAFIAIFLITGAFLSKLVLVVSILGALGASYTTYLYVREQLAQQSQQSSAEPLAQSPASDADSNEGETP